MSWNAYQFSDVDSCGAVNTKAIRQQQHQQNEENGFIYTNNIMFDSRVVRGNTYATPVITEEQQRNRAVYERNHRARRSREEEQRQRAVLVPPGTPPPVAGRMHMDMQTEPYLEELIVEQPSAATTETQTDDMYFTTMPKLPESVSTRSEEKHRSTQLDPAENSNLEEEVTPILDSLLIGTTPEEGVCEMAEEKETSAILQRKRDYEMKRGREVTDVERLESVAEQTFEEKQRCLQRGEEYHIEREMKMDEVEAQELSKDILMRAKDSAISKLDASGYFEEPAPV